MLRTVWGCFLIFFGFSALSGSVASFFGFGVLSALVASPGLMLIPFVLFLLSLFLFYFGSRLISSGDADRKNPPPLPPENSDGLPFDF